MDLVTGGAGFIGSHLVEGLVRRGTEVRVLDDLSTGDLSYLTAVEDRIDFLQGDILDMDAVRAAMRGVRRVFHLAALRSVPRSVDDPVSSNAVNVEGTLNVLMAARAAGVERVVYASSSSVYGTTDALPMRETQPVHPLSPYAVSKLAGEYYCSVFTRLYGLPTVALRYFNVFGPRQSLESRYAAVIPRFVTAALRGDSLPIHGDGLQSRDFTYVSNVVKATCLAAEREEAIGEVLNVAGGEEYRLLDIVELLGGLLGGEPQPVKWHHTPVRPGDVRHTRADISKAERLLGYRVVTGFEEGLKQTIEAMHFGTSRLPIAP